MNLEEYAVNKIQALEKENSELRGENEMSRKTILRLNTMVEQFKNIFKKYTDPVSEYEKGSWDNNIRFYLSCPRYDLDDEENMQMYKDYMMLYEIVPHKKDVEEAKKKEEEELKKRAKLAKEHSTDETVDEDLEIPTDASDEKITEGDDA